MSVRLIDCDRSRAQEILAILNEAIEHSTALYDYHPRTMYRPAYYSGYNGIAQRVVCGPWGCTLQ